MEADWTCEHVEQLVATTGKSVRVACYPVPLTPGSTRRRTRWAFVLVTDADERLVRQVLWSWDVDFAARRHGQDVLVAWPPEEDPRDPTAWFKSPELEP